MEIEYLDKTAKPIIDQNLDLVKALVVAKSVEILDGSVKFEKDGDIIKAYYKGKLVAKIKQ